LRKREEKEVEDGGRERERERGRKRGGNVYGRLPHCGLQKRPKGRTKTELADLPN